DKKDTICKRCGHECLTPQKLHEHLKRKNLCKPLQKQKEVASIQTPIQVSIQKANQQVESFSINMSNKEKPYVVIPTPVLEKEATVFGARLQKCWKELDLDVELFEANDLDGCLTLFHDLKLNDPEVVCLSTLKELEKYKKISKHKAGPEPKTQAHRNDISKVACRNLGV
ncbi:hypothetical protein RhiirC2_804279, partial [Rhizophagus irregularis]